MLSRGLIHEVALHARHVCGIALLSILGAPLSAAEPPAAVTPVRTYQNRLVKLKNPQPLLADYPEFVQPIEEEARYEAPVLVDDPEATIELRAWRFSYNARGIVEMPNRLDGRRTAVIMVHPWGIDDGQGWQTPEPAGVCDFCTPTKNHLAARHTRTVIDPLLARLRPHVACTMFSLPGSEDPIRRQLYRSIRAKPNDAERSAGRTQLKAALSSFAYRGEPLPGTLELSATTPVSDYFRQFPGLDAGARYNNDGFWKLPIPITADVKAEPDDIVIYDAEGYAPLRDYLKAQGVRHVVLTGYATDMCFCRTTAGYENLERDFNVFLVGDATLATFPSNTTPRYATNASISFAALNHLVTQASWIRTPEPERKDAERTSSAAKTLVRFAAMGDVPSAPAEDELLPRQIAELPRDAEFVIHLGDIKTGNTPCDETVYAKVSGLLGQSAARLFIIPGDNEWNDCADPDAAWQLWRRHFGRFEERWPGGFGIFRQLEREENFSFVRNRVLFLGLNLVGGRVHDAEEWRRRHAENLDWVRRNLRQFGDEVSAVVLFGHVNPVPVHDDFFTGFVEEATARKKPFLYLHGDGHRWIHDRPFAAKNVLRVQVDQGGIAPPVLVDVTDNPDEPFVFDRKLGK